MHLLVQCVLWGNQKFLRRSEAGRTCFPGRRWRGRGTCLSWVRRGKKTAHRVGVLCPSAPSGGMFSRPPDHCPFPAVLSVSSGSEKGSASWAMLRGLCVSCWKLLAWGACAVPGWNMEGLGLWVLHVWPGPSDLPDWGVCQSGVCPGKERRHLRLDCNAVSGGMGGPSPVPSLSAAEGTTRLNAQFQGGF